MLGRTYTTAFSTVKKDMRRSKSSMRSGRKMAKTSPRKVGTNLGKLPTTDRHMRE